MKTVFALLVGLVLLVPFVVEADQKDKKPWNEWTQKEAEKMLNNSPWAQIQTETDTSEMFFSPTADPRTAGSRAPNSDARLAQGATNQATNLKYGIRFFSARPIRQAFMRLIQLKQKDLEPDVVNRMKTFAEMESADSIIVAVTIEGTDKRSLNQVMQLFNSATSGTLKNTTYLERSDGKRVFLEEYVPPGRDGFGARFIFPRMADEKPFLTPEISDVRFVSEFGSIVKLNRQFKVADMMLDGKLEY
ncbi:MAG TPA: hypothetical protein VJ875_21180 [Pyrinomonadaceae bacterium]|nr:hypothetical protein [Pyrinomonadaceae bacterium]